MISVIMPVKNAENTILQAAASILKQTYTNLELIIIDDHSTDNSIAVVRTLSDPRIKIVDNSSQGIAMALNTGIKYARGNYLARMDADDLSYPMRLERQLQFLLANPDVDVVSCLVEYKTNIVAKQSGYNLHVNWLNSLLTPTQHYVNRFADAPVAHPTVLFKADVPIKYGHYLNKPYPEDFELWLRWFKKGVRFAKIPERLFIWYDHQNRLSRTSSSYAILKFFEVKARYFSLWWQKNGKGRLLWVWGYGKEVFKKSDFLSAYGLDIEGYYDIKDRPDALRKVRLYNQVKADPEQFILVYIGDREGKQHILNYFNHKNMTAGKDFLFMS